MSPVVTRWGAQRPFYCERSEPSCQERAPRSEAQRSALQQLVHIIRETDRIKLFVATVYEKYSANAILRLIPKRLYKKELQSEKYEVMGGSV